jgi:hypothetical protein
MVEVTTWPGGGRGVAVPEECDEGHPLTDGQRTTLLAQALRIVIRREAEARGEPANGSGPGR